jgi:predicted MFS family arabinose efflux permease
MTPPLPTLPGSRRHLAPRSAFVLTVSVVVCFLAASSAPSPLYGLYREAWGFSAAMLTAVFASYAFALLAALLLFGSLSDHLGRRTVIVLALVLEIVSVLLFWQAPSVGWLFAARIVQGLATGIATSALSAMLLDLHPRRGALFNSVAPMLGMGLGALGTGLLVQYAGRPTHLVFELLLPVLALQTLLAWWLPDTVVPRPGVWRSLRPQVEVPAAARATLWRVLPLNTAGWALGGFYLSLGPTLARQVTDSASPVVGGALITTLVISGAVAIVFVQSRPPRGVLLGSAATLAAGLAVTLAGVQAHAAWAFFGGTLVAGLGFGAGFNGAVRSLVPLAAPHERAGLMASFFVLSYLAFAIPAIAAGLGAGWVGLKTTALGYGGLLVLLALVALAASLRQRGHDTGAAEGQTLLK